MTVGEDARNRAEPVRLDKWLWAARFYKTRSLATDAIQAGHVKLAGEKAKPAKAVHVGDEIVLTLPPFQHVIEVKALSDVRRGAPEARLLYEETPESRVAREALAALLKSERAAWQAAPTKPSKRDRRAIDRLRGR